MLRLVVLLAFTLTMVAGCGGNGNPPQPKISDDQVKDIMKNAKEQSKKEGGDRSKIK